MRFITTLIVAASVCNGLIAQERTNPSDLQSLGEKGTKSNALLSIRELKYRIVRAREQALSSQNGGVVRRLQWLVDASRNRLESIDESMVRSELTKVETALKLNLPTKVEVTGADKDDLRALIPMQVERNVAYSSDNGSSRLTSLDIYAAPGKKGEPVLVWIHGGGLKGGDKAHPGVTLVKPDYFVSHGFVFVSINYRLLPDHQHPVFISDATKAVAWVHNNIARFGGDPDRLFLIGHSAGAHLSALMCTNDRFLKAAGKGLGIIKGAVILDIASYDFAAVLERMSETERKASLYIQAHGPQREAWIDASPARHVARGKNIPPMLLIYAESRGEHLRVENQRFSKLLLTAGCQVSLKAAKRKTHESLNYELGFRGDHPTKDVLDFLLELDEKP